MRKHFLILMLLTLLPLAGFAADFTTEATVTVLDKYFGKAPTNADVTVVINSTSLGAAKYQIEDDGAGHILYYTDASLTSTVALAAGKTTPAVGTYYLKITPADTDNSGVAAGKIIVRPMPLDVTVTNASKTYGEADPVSYTITAITDADANDVKAAMLSKITVIREAGENVKAGNYNFSNTTVSDANYEIGTVTGTFTINAKAFARGTGAGTVTITVSNNEKTYSGVAQTPTVVVHDNDLNKDLAAEDFALSYEGDDNTTWTAGRTITVTGARNYAPTAIALGADEKLIINKKALSIFVDDKVKIYDGTTDIGDVTFTYSGLVGPDVALEEPFGDNFTPVYASATGDEYKVGTYGLKATAGTPGGNFANYDVTYPTIGQLTVVQRNVTITVADKSKSFGADNPAFTYTVAGVDGDTGATTTTKFGGATDKALLEGIYNVVRTSSSEEVAEYANDLTLSQKSGLNNNQKGVLAQYHINEVKGKFTITTATLTVAPKKVTVTYGEDYDLADFEVIATNTSGKRVTLTTTPTVKFKEDEYNTNNPTAAGVYTLVLDGTIAATGYDGEAAVRNEGQLVIKKKEVTIQLAKQTLMVNDGEDALLASKVKFLDAQGKNGIVGNDVIGYKLEFNTTNTAVVGLVPTGDVAAAVGIDAAAAAAYNSNLVGAIELTTVLTEAQAEFMNAAPGAGRTTYVAGETPDLEADVNAYNAALDGAVAAGDNIAAAVQAYNTGTEKLVANGDFAKGLKISEDLLVEGNANANYDIAWVSGIYPVTGQLVVLDAAFLALNSDDDDLANVVKLNNEDLAAGNISIDLSPRNGATLGSEREWGAKQWNALVLPFDITVAELSQAFGYAIVNVVDASKTTANNVQFKLEMDEVKANTPFTIKTAKKLIDATPGVGITVDGVITFGGAHKVVAPTAAQKTGVDAGMGYKFVPVYETLTVDKNLSNYRFLLGNYAKWAYIKADSENTWDIVPFAAYVDLSAAAAPEMVTFTFQEIDGSTTTVKAIESGLADAASKGYAADGIYNLNGMKMNSVPTQKGVYILNGKKVVIK